MEKPSELRKSVNENLIIFEAVAERAMQTHNSKDLQQTLMLLKETIHFLRGVYIKLEQDIGKFI